MPKRRRHLQKYDRRCRPNHTVRNNLVVAAGGRQTEIWFLLAPFGVTSLFTLRFGRSSLNRAGAYLMVA